MNFNQLISFIILKTIEHLELTFITVFLASVIAIPFSIFLAKLKNPTGRIILKIALELQNIPPLALIALIMAFLIVLRKFFDFSVIGVIPSILILVFFAVLPIFCCTFNKMKKLSYNKNINVRTMLRLAMKEICEGVREATVLTVAVATLVSIIGSGGLGDLILKGLKSLSLELILAGSLPAAFLGIMLNQLVTAITKWILLTKKS